MLLLIEYYKMLVETTGLSPVFFGQISANPYIDELRRAFPMAPFVSGTSPIIDFETLRRSSNVAICVSTFSWLAAWLSQAKRIFMPLTGLFNPFQHVRGLLAPVGDTRYTFHLFPANYAVPVEDFRSAHDRLHNSWRLIASDELEHLLHAAPRHARNKDRAIAVFDEDFYVSRFPDIEKAIADGRLKYGLDHFITNGFSEGRSPLLVDERWYTRSYPQAALEIGRGDYEDSTHHYVEVGALQGYLPCKPISRPSRVLVRRWWGMGDLIMVTPVIARLRAELGEGTETDIVTGCPSVFQGHPHVRTINQDEVQHLDYDRVVDLDGAYEKNRSVHAIDAYMLTTWGNTDWNDRETLPLQRAPKEDIAVDWRKAVVLHAGAGQRNRMMPRNFWDELILIMIAEGLTPVIVGTGKDEKWPDVAGVVDLSNKHGVNETAWVIAQSLCFMSCDTDVMHIAGTTRTPMVTIYTSVLPEQRMPWRCGELGWKTIALVPRLECVGCNAGKGCNRGDFACVEGAEAITPNAVLQAIIECVTNEHAL